MERINVGTSKRGQSCNVLTESSQSISGKCGFIGESKRCEVQRETRDLVEKLVEITMVPREIKECEVGEPLEETAEERA
jgi:hypothetical protein